MARVAIVVVTYNSEDEIGPCLDALSDLEDVEIVVVDNASSDSTLSEVASRVRRQNVQLIASEVNRGFAGGVNLGVASTSAPFVLLLNPDARLQRPEASLSALVRAFEKPGTGVAGGVLLGVNGHPQTGFMARNLPTPGALIFELLGINRLWPANPVNWHYRCLDERKINEAEQPAGAFMMFTRAAFTQVGGFDERFCPVWFEDVDFCARLKAAGFRSLCIPEAVAIHTGGHSVGRLPVEIRQRYWYVSLLEYAAKYYRPVTFRTICLAVAVGAVFRAIPGVVGGCAEGRGKVIEVYGAVVRLALGRFLEASSQSSDKGMS